MLWDVPVLGAILLAVGFLLLNQDFTGLFQALAEDTQRRYVGGEPLSDLIMVVMVVAAVASLLIMFFWPRFEPPKQQLLVRYYFADADGYRQPIRRSYWSSILHYYLMAIARLRRVYAHFAS